MADPRMPSPRISRLLYLNLHMPEIVCLLGEPPSTFLQRSSHTWHLFDENGKWKAQPPISFMSLGTRMRQFSGESREEFLDFMGCMVRWLPEERWTARQLLQHSWLNGINWDLM